MMPETYSFIGYEVDHIIPLKHGGTNAVENLAWSCAICNKNKGTDVATYLFPSSKLVPLFNPRRDKWDEHFLLTEAQIIPKTEIGEASIKIFQLNHPNRMIERLALIDEGLW
jgi:5-methylcytosine-specific restriction endonuclease McrA